MGANFNSHAPPGQFPAGACFNPCVPGQFPVGFNSRGVRIRVAGQLPVSRVESVPGFQMHSEDFPALPGTTKSNGEYYEFSICTSK